jgi:hypothetical protein
MMFEGETAKAKYVNDYEKKVRAALDEGESFWNEITEDAQISIYKYSDRRINFKINDYLYNDAKVSDEIKFMAEQIELALNHASLPEDMLLYRGVCPQIWMIMKADPGYAAPGNEIIPKGFLSSTYDRSTAYKYATKNAKDSDEIAMIEILAPKGTKALSIEKHSQSPEDREILINRATRFKVVEARKYGNVMRLIWEAIT